MHFAEFVVLGKSWGWGVLFHRLRHLFIRTRWLPRGATRGRVHVDIMCRPRELTTSTARTVVHDPVRSVSLSLP